MAILIGRIEIGVEAQITAVLVLDQRRLIIDQIGIVIESDWAAAPARGALMVNRIAFEFAVLRREGLAPPEADHAPRPGAHQALVHIQIVAAFLEQKPAGLLAMAPPIAHKERAMFRRDMFRGLDTGYGAEGALAHQAPHIPVNWRVAQHHTHQYPIALAVAADRLQQGVGLRLGDHQRFLYEDPHARVQPLFDMLQVHKIR